MNKKGIAGSPKTMPGKIIRNPNYLFLFLMLVIVVAHGLYYFPFPFKDGIPALVDLTTHYLRAKLFFDGYGIYDWFHGQFLGATPFTFYPPFLYFLIFSISKLSFGIISLDLSFKICLVLVYAGTPFSVYYALRTLTFDKIFSILAAFLSLYISYFAGFGPDGYFGIGLFSNGLAMLFFLPALAHFDRFMFSEEKNVVIKNLILSLVLVSLVMATNILVSVFLLLIALLVFLVELIINTRIFLIKRFFFFVTAIPFLNAFWVLPFLYYQNLSGPDANWSGVTFLEFCQKFIRGEFFGSSLLLNAVAVIGFLVSLVFLRKERKYRLFLMITIAGVAFGIVAPVSLPGFLGKIQFALLNRSFSFISFPIAVFAATTFIFTLKSLKIEGRKLSIILIPLAILFAVYSHEWLSGKSRLTVTESNYTSPQDENFRDLIVWIKDNADGQVVSLNRTALGSALNGINYTHLDTWVSLKTGAFLLDGTYIPQTKYPMKGDIFNNLAKPHYDQYQLQKKLETWGVRYFVVGTDVSPKLKNDLFEKIYSNDTFVVYTIAHPGFPKIVRIKSTKNTALFHVNTANDNTVSLPVNYHPNWEISINGEAANYVGDAENLVRVGLPKGESVIEMKFSMGAIEIISIILSLFSIAICSFLLLVGRMQEKLWGLIASPIIIQDKGNTNQIMHYRFVLLMMALLSASMLVVAAKNHFKHQELLPSHKLAVSDTAYNLTDQNWINGVAISWAGFFVDNNSANLNALRPGKKVAFVDGSERVIVRQSQNGPYLNIDLSGSPLDGSKVGYPHKFIVTE